MDEKCECCTPRKIRLKILPLPEAVVEKKKIFEIDHSLNILESGENENINKDNLSMERVIDDEVNNGMGIDNKRLMVGCHIGLDKSLYDTVARCKMTTCQFHLGSPFRYSCRKITESDRAKTLEYCDQNESTFYVHSPLIANVANAEREDIPQKSLEAVSRELEILNGLPAASVLHIGKRGTISNVVNRLNHLEFKSGDHPRMRQQLLLETAAGQGTELGSKWEELRHLYEGLDTSRIGLCVDTQHSFAAGMCQFQTSDQVDHFFDDIVSMLSSKSTSENSLLRMIHLNDSVVPFGKKVDRHASLGQGYIWQDRSSKEGLLRLIEQTKNRGIDLISETPTPFDDIVVTKVLDKNLN